MSSPSSDSTKTSESAENPELLLDRQLTPMEAVNILYSHGEEELTEAIIASLSRQVFHEEPRQPAGILKRVLARVVFRLLKLRTKREVTTGPDGEEQIAYRNRLLESSGHPYAMTLLEPTGAHTDHFVEGGDPMNAPYMMIVPEVRQNGCKWDRILLDSIQGKDVQLRFIWEARSTYEAARQRLEGGKPVRIKAAAAGTGLCPILVFDRLIRDGYDPKLITLIMTDREESNVAKTRLLLGKLSTTRDHPADSEEHQGIAARVMDLFHATPSQGQPGGHDGYHVVTLVGILEYFRGFTCSTTEEHFGNPVAGDESEASELIGKMAAMTAESGVLIANTYRVEIAARILEIFGKKLRFRNPEDLHALAATASFYPLKSAGSGNVYDVEVFEKRASA